MARITIGNVNYIYELWDSVGNLDNPFDYTADLIQENFRSEITQTAKDGSLVTIDFNNNRTGVISDAKFLEDGSLDLTAKKYQYFSDNGSNVELFGELVFRGGYLDNSSKIKSIKVNDPSHILDPSGKGISVALNGKFRLFSDTAEPWHFRMEGNSTEMIRMLSSGAKLVFGENRFFSTDKPWTGVTDSFSGFSPEGLQVFKMLDADFWEEIEYSPIETAQDFVNFFFSGNDHILGTPENDNLYSGAGNDSVVAGAGADEIDGGDGADKLAGGEGADDLTGGAGNDALDGGTGDDVLYSGEGNDSVSGGDGADLIVGGDGAGNDTYDGGKGVDTVKYTSAKAGIRIDLTKGTAGSITSGDAAGIGSDKLKGIENVISGDFADLILGGKDANSITGDSGDDTIDGGLGNDTLTGGLGADVFVFSTKSAANNRDTISDFQSDVDKIQLSLKIFAKLKGASDYLVNGTPTAPTHYLIYDSASGKLSYDADGNGTKIKPVDIALIGQGLALTTADFIVV